MAKYGFPYMGSKADIADELIEILPVGKRFVDLFGGGGAMTHAAAYSRKWQTILYNEFNPLCVNLMRRAVNGEFNYKTFEPEFISREEFFKRKDSDGYVKYIWSFGNKGKNYLFGKNIEEFKRQGHQYCVFGESIDGVPECAYDDIKSRRMFLKNYCAKEFKQIINSTPTMAENYRKYQEIMNTASKLNRDVARKQALKFTQWLRSTGITCKEVDALSGSQMSSHFMSNGSQPAIPTPDMWQKIKQSPKIKEVPSEIELLLNPDLRLQRLQRLQQLEQLERLQQLEQLERLQQLEQLERLQQLERLEINCGSYTEYEHQEGDVVYCDPPYEGTTEYSDAFDSQSFYDWVASRNYQVYFSSYEINDTRFHRIWERRRCAKLAANTNQTERVEVLYCNSSAINTNKQMSIFDYFEEAQ